MTKKSTLFFPRYDPTPGRKINSISRPGIGRPTD